MALSSIIPAFIGWLLLLVQGVPPSRGHLGRGTTKTALRRAISRLRFAVNSVRGDVVNPQQTPTGGILIDVDGATVTFDLSIYNFHQVTLGGNRTLALANVNVIANQRFAVRLVQDGTGSRTVTWWSGIKWPGGTVPTLTTAAGKADWFGFVTTGSGAYDGFILGQNF